MRSSKWMKILALVLMGALTLAVSAEGFVHHHHHSDTEDRDCAYCSFDKAVSSMDIPVIALDLAPLFMLFLVFLLPEQPFKVALFSAQSGRSPPAVLS